MSQETSSSVYESKFAASDDSNETLVDRKKFQVNRPIKMSQNTTISVIESKFAASDKTDAVLVVDDKKIHVNKALLSCHSEYFNILFNGEFKEKLLSEIPIEDVEYEDFATLLSLVHPNPIKPKEETAEKLLELADRFMLPAAKFTLELFLITTPLTKMQKIQIADKYKLDSLLNHATASLLLNEICGIRSKLDFKRITDNTKSKMSETPAMSIYETTFAKSDKTDAVLIVEGKKLHVNKALFSCHSTHFKSLFQSTTDMSEYPIEDVNFEEFATLLSQIQLNPIKPTVENAENVLKLADRFALPAAKRHVELFLTSTYMENIKKIRIGAEYQLNILLKQGCSYYRRRLENLVKDKQFESLSDKSKANVLHAIFEIVHE